MNHHPYALARPFFDPIAFGVALIHAAQVGFTWLSLLAPIVIGVASLISAVGGSMKVYMQFTDWYESRGPARGQRRP